MKLKFVATVLTLLLSIFSTLVHAQQIKTEPLSYSACEARSTTDSGRLIITATAENYGSISPCRGSFEIYINKNSEVRSLRLDVLFLNRDNQVLAEQKLQDELEGPQTGMFSKEIFLKELEGKTCRSVRISIRSVTCFSAEGNAIDCPEIRLIPPDVFHMLTIENESINVCRDK